MNLRVPAGFGGTHFVFGSSFALTGLIVMEGKISWDSYSKIHFGGSVARFEQVNESNEEAEFDIVSLDNILPNDILERIFSFLPIASIFRAACVCKRWNDVVHSRKPLWANRRPQKPWYFMFTCNDTAEGYAYDPDLRKWYSIELPCIEKSNWFISSSSGLVCFMDSTTRSRIFVCNPITRDWRRLITPPGVKSPDYSALSISMDRKSSSYDVIVVKTKQVPEDFLQWELAIHVYDSESELWATFASEVLVGWRGGDESVVCKGVLYCLIHCAGAIGNPLVRHGLVVYDLSVRSTQTSLKSTLIPVPCSLTCGRLMNLNNKLVMVGGIAKRDRPDIIKGIGIWVLHEKEWREVARMPHKYFQGFGEFDDVFASSGSDDLIYIQSYGATALLAFDMNQRQWRWSQKCPVTKRFPLQLFTGFCFVPRLEVAS
ncbi:F-box/kelch-repeat protein [Apostasia shenzhenica]|uniref:F-box/kelch-repeat protein n=1 Tax=Apostasia shenzhenica TaxID=1088818 RepID=A0A2I0BFW8_9ASPA|nr:F-box/kelch-repeat protein [Apostasia shenzhenica]